MRGRWLHTTRSSLYVPTMKECPNDAVLPGYQYLLRAGYIRKASNGIYMYLPLAVRSLSKIESLIDHHMQAIECSKTAMPHLLSDKLWKKTGRWESTGSELIRVTDRHDDNFCLAPTHEEIFTNLVASTIFSHNELPLKLYQIGRKFRDEIRPRFGLLRAKEFVMKDAYTFDINAEAAQKTYTQFVNAYHHILKQLNVPYVQVEADSGNIGGSLSHEFHILSDFGEDTILSCNSCNYAANDEKATSRVQGISQVETFYFGFENSSKTCSVCVPKNRMVNVVAIENHFNQSVYSLEKKPEKEMDHILVDNSAAIVADHNTIRGDFRLAQDADQCPNCDGILSERKGIEVGHVFYLGDKYSNVLDAKVLDSKQKKRVLEMGCYGLGVSRILAAVVESQCDDKGIRWPESIAPYLAIVISIGNKHGTDLIAKTAVRVAETIEGQVAKLQNNVVLDNRWKQSPGMKLAEAELIGYPYILVVGRSFKTDGTIEVQHRNSNDVAHVPLSDIAQFLTDKLNTEN